jgi:type II secretory pathway pseudopilin PulG
MRRRVIYECSWKWSESLARECSRSTRLSELIDACASWYLPCDLPRGALFYRVQARSATRHFRHLPFEAFTLIEIMLVVAIFVLMLALAIPSLTGLSADKRLRRSLDAFNNLVHQAQELSVAENRAYLIVWTDAGADLRPEVFQKDEEKKPTAVFPFDRDSVLKLLLPSALRKEYPAEWIFWPCGICEPAIVEFYGHDGQWKAKYSPLTAHAEILNYVTR